MVPGLVPVVELQDVAVLQVVEDPDLSKLQLLNGLPRSGPSSCGFSPRI
jgi:hypothetical protein